MANKGSIVAKDFRRFFLFGETLHLHFRFCLIFLIILFVNGANNNSSQLAAQEEQSKKVHNGISVPKHLQRISKENDVPGEYGVLIADYHMSGSMIEASYCVYHYNGKYIPKTKEKGKTFSIMDLTSLNVSCITPMNQTTPNTIVLIRYEQACSNISKVASIIESSFGSAGVLVVVPQSIEIKSLHIKTNSTKNPKFVIALISSKSAEDITSKILESNAANVTVLGFDEMPSSFDYSYLVIWSIAVITVCLGSYWSGVVRAQLFRKKQLESEVKITSRQDREAVQKEVTLEEEPYLNISPIWVLAFVGCMALMLLALYFFYNYLVYLIIGLFVIASIMSTFTCLDQLAQLVLPSSWLSISVTTCLKPPKKAIYQILIGLIAISFPIYWVITRKQNYSWILQDLLGILFSINMLRTIRLPSFKICFILLSLLFFYDIFFVFITPLITKGESVMVEVATGGGKYEGNGGGSKVGEQLPMVIRVPHLSFRNESDPADVCRTVTRTYSLLGFGDILVPGLLVSYCHAFDIIHNVPKRLYFVIGCISYGLGLIATFFGLYFMNGIAQPALLYLVPFTIIPLVITGLIRKEMTKFWNGPGDGSKDNSSWAKPQESTIRPMQDENSLLAATHERKDAAEQLVESVPGASRT